MATTMRTQEPSRTTAENGRDGHVTHVHRTAKIVEIMCSSAEDFEDAIRCGLEDASQTTRGITGAHVENFSVRCQDGKITEYKVNLKIAFGVERTVPVEGGRSAGADRRRP